MVDKKSILPFIKAQLPKHITDSDSLFPSFIEAYYEWLNKPENAQYTLYTLSTVTNIDKSIEAFTEEFFAEYLNKFPTNLLTDKSLTIKHIVDLYKAKGTPAAYKLLFRILYNDKIDIIYPGDFVFKPSDNRWVQDFTFFVTIKQGNIQNLVGEEVIVNTVNGNVIVFVERIKFIRDGYYQIYIDKSYIGTISFGDTVTFEDVICTIVPTTTKVRIKQKGSGFKLGDVFLLADGIGYGSTVKVSKIDDNGGILAVTFIEYGVGYSSNFDFNVSTASASVTDTVIPGANTTVNDYIKNIIDSGYIVQNNYVDVNYSEPTYIGAILSTFYAETANASDPNAAIFSVEIGAIAKYLGYWESNKSFPSDNIYIHDGEYYQTYSYVINSQIQFNEYKDILKNLIHPAGFALFGQYEILNSFDIGASLQNLINAFKVALLDVVYTDDTNISFNVNTVLSDSFALSDFLTKSAIKVLTDTQSVADSAPKFTFTKSLTDSVTVTDLINYINTISNLTDSTSMTDLLAVSMIKALADSASAVDAAPNLSTTKVLSDSQAVTDNATRTFTKALTDSITVTDLLNYINTGSVLSDAQSVTDVSTNTVTKVLSDSATPTDDEIFNMTKVLSDTLGALSDSASIAFTKVLSDSVTITDDRTVVPTYPKEDSTTATDLSTYAFTKALADSATPTDVYSYNITKILADSFGLTDAATKSIEKPFTETLTATDTNAISFSTSVSEILSVTDDDTYAFTKALNETLISVDTGDVWLNPYVIDSSPYFAEDYIEGKVYFYGGAAPQLDNMQTVYLDFNEQSYNVQEV